ncbi:MAG: SMC-Scp complex subunit ScpB [Thermaerobacter sp.]|nr:SMC-Scp complex subunit ScpB [Thermaerobacter sp.]
MASWRELEGFLFASGGSHSEDAIARHLGTTALEVRVLLGELEQRLEGHAIVLSWHDGEVSLTTAPDLGAYLSDRLPAAPGEISAAALEALALVAYRQPVTRAEIDEVRGVRSERTVQTLLELGLIEVVGRSQGIGRAPLYGTTGEFLRRFNLGSLADLPELAQAEPEEEAF